MPVIIAHGLGGGGSMYCPRISPWASAPDLLFVSCDLTGLYRSENGGGTWTLLDGRKVQGWFRFSVAFNPANPGHIVAFHPAFGLQESTSYGAEGTWMPLSPMKMAQPQVTAAGFFQDGTI